MTKAFEGILSAQRKFSLDPLRENRRTLSGGQVTEDAVLCRGMGNPAWGAGRVPTFSTQIPLMDAKPEKL